MINNELSRALARIADLLEIDGAEPFRVNSFRRAARTIKELVEDVALVANEKRLTKLPGIGKGTAQRIEQFLESGHIDILDELQSKLPEGLPCLLEIQGMGPKKVAQVHRELGVTSLDDLKREIEADSLASLAGFGKTSVQRIVEGIAFLEQSGGRTPLGRALPLAEALQDLVAKLDGVRRVEIAGSIRRGRETIGDIDLLCVADDGERVVKEFTQSELARRVLAAGSTKGSITVAADDDAEIQVDLRVVPQESFGAAMQYFTGSKEHNVWMRERAVRRSWRLNEYGLYDGDDPIAGEEEKAIYDKLEVAHVPPELREQWGELNAPSGGLVSVADIKGDLHMHTTASDGKHSIEEMADAAETLGYEYIAICDHSQSATIANGLSEDRMRKHIEAIRAVSAKRSAIEVLVGCECDILADGSLDYPDELLSECDWVVASIHSAMGKGGKGKLSPTDRTLRAMDNPYVSIIGHPTGRLINRRAAMELDMAAIVKAAQSTRTFLEVNASWQRLDLKDAHVRQALDAGVKIGINTDAHSKDGLGQIRYGVSTARRGGASVADVVNCLGLSALRDAVASKRGS